MCLQTEIQGCFNTGKRISIAKSVRRCAKGKIDCYSCAIDGVVNQINTTFAVDKVITDAADEGVVTGTT